METIERPINIEIRYVFGDFSGTKSSGMLMEYTMAPEPERLRWRRPGDMPEHRQHGVLAIPERPRRGG
jgi:hypothetical protein